MTDTKPSDAQLGDTFPERILNSPETARLLGVSERTLLRMDLPKIRLSAGRVGFPQSALMDWIKQRTIQPKHAA